MYVCLSMTVTLSDKSPNPTHRFVQSVHLQPTHQQLTFECTYEL